MLQFEPEARHNPAQNYLSAREKISLTEISFETDTGQAEVQVFHLNKVEWSLELNCSVSPASCPCAACAGSLCLGFFIKGCE